MGIRRIHSRLKPPGSHGGRIHKELSSCESGFLRSSLNGIKTKKEIEETYNQSQQSLHIHLFIFCLSKIFVTNTFVMKRFLHIVDASARTDPARYTLKLVRGRRREVGRFKNKHISQSSPCFEAKSRKYQGVFEVKSRVKTWQVRGIWSQQLEH